MLAISTYSFLIQSTSFNSQIFFNHKLYFGLALTWGTFLLHYWITKPDFQKLTYEEEKTFLHFYDNYFQLWNHLVNIIASRKTPHKPGIIRIYAFSWILIELLVSFSYCLIGKNLVSPENQHFQIQIIPLCFTFIAFSVILYVFKISSEL